MVVDLNSPIRHYLVHSLPFALDFACAFRENQ
jgi:hypothetical protein|uniref:Uncharacterized protein n=1 Tax=Myoviridae sp. ctzyI3 TaxID=2826722 RepID=A0A8S5MM35_9CAUD|nr:MAG TPA: hypothetical protein [Myoviridae sp. ctzyI3]DAF02695.1 MAG TPA: hypothetical protein [Caudoviricetes sp.]DAM72619.1 MAG TPA: hypothetical protein [Caudoviricetes sp.]